MLLNSTKYDILDKDIIHAIILTLKDGIIVGFDNEYLNRKNINYFSLWLITREIKEIYIESADAAARAFFDRMEITVRTYEDVKDNPLFRAFLL